MEKYSTCPMNKVGSHLIHWTSAVDSDSDSDSFICFLHIITVNKINLLKTKIREWGTSSKTEYKKIWEKYSKFNLGEYSNIIPYHTRMNTVCISYLSLANRVSHVPYWACGANYTMVNYTFQDIDHALSLWQWRSSIDQYWLVILEYKSIKPHPFYLNTRESTTTLQNNEYNA